MLAEILKQDDTWLEITHDYIQWLFPLAELSRASVNAPLLDNATIQAFKSDELLRNHMRASFVRMLRFYGLRASSTGVGKGENWALRKSEWFLENTHNSLRLTRMLKSLSALGMTWEALALQSTLRALCETEPDCGIDLTAQQFWSQAVNAA